MFLQVLSYQHNNCVRMSHMCNTKHARMQGSRAQDLIQETFKDEI